MLCDWLSQSSEIALERQNLRRRKADFSERGLSRKGKLKKRNFEIAPNSRNTLYNRFGGD